MGADLPQNPHNTHENEPLEPNPFEPPNTYASRSGDHLGSACKWLKAMGYILILMGAFALVLGICSLLGVIDESALPGLLSIPYFFAAWLTFRAAAGLKTNFDRYRKRTQWLVIFLSILALPYCTVPGILVLWRMARHRRETASAPT